MKGQGKAPCSGSLCCDKVLALQKELEQLKDAVLIASPVMKAHAEPTSLAMFLSKLRRSSCSDCSQSRKKS